MDAAKVVAPYYKVLNLYCLFSRMFPSSNNVKHAGRYFEQFVKVAHAKGSQKDAVVKNLLASMYTSSKLKYTQLLERGSARLGHVKNIDLVST